MEERQQSFSITENSLTTQMILYISWKAPKSQNRTSRRKKKSRITEKYRKAVKSEKKNSKALALKPPQTKNRLKRTEQEAASSLWSVVLFASTYTRTFAIKRLLSSHATFVYCFHNHRRSLCEKLLRRCLEEEALCSFSSVHSTRVAGEGVRRSHAIAVIFHCSNASH